MLGPKTPTDKELANPAFKLHVYTLNFALKLLKFYF